MITSHDSKTIRANFLKAKVLVIEDNTDHWTLIERAMQRSMPEVTPVGAMTSAQALTYLRDWTAEGWEIPKLILLDLYLPDREDGWKLLEQIKGLPAPCNQIPVVILSSSSYPGDINEAYLRGSSSYLVKPTTVDGWLGHFQQLRNYWLETVTLPPARFSI